MAPPVTNGVDHTDDDDVEIDYSDIIKKYEVESEEGFDNIVVVDGVPVVDKSKLDKLLAKISKEFVKRGAHIKADSIFVPWDDAVGKSKGFVFMEFGSPQEAAHAIATMNGHPFDARHTFTVNLFTDIEKFATLDESFVEPKAQEYRPKEHLRAWLADPQGRDQYATYRHDDVTINWHGKPSQSEIAHEKKNWTQWYIMWSPQGTMLATLHPQGVKLWSGPNWSESSVQRFPHKNVRLLDFSRSERYLATFSPDPISLRELDPRMRSVFSEDDEGNNIVIWDIKTGRLLRTFSAPVGEGSKMAWPVFKWSSDDRYVARVTPGQQISVYELPDMGLLDKKSIKIDGVVDFDWSPVDEREDEKDGKSSKSKKPRENVLAYWTPEMGNQPARVSLISIPSRTVLRTKNLFNVNECKLYWQNQGDFLCVKVDRHTKTKKSTFCNLEIFRVREKDYPVEVVELKDTVTDFSWEPCGERFAIISTSDPNVGNAGVTIKTDVSFYQLEHGKNDFKLLKTLSARTSNTIRWSPRGRHVVLATVGSPSKSELEFWDLDFNVDDIVLRRDNHPSKEEWGSGIQHLGTADHYGVTDVEWDPSGRYLATSASVWRHTLENGYAIWDFKGQEIEKHILDRFKQFLWRPRPKTLLSKEQQKKIRKNLREYSRVFEEEDAAEESNVSAELIAHRKRLVDEWNAWRVKCKDERKRRGKYARAVQGESVQEEIAVWVDEVVEQIEEEVIE